jgi:hypothetical protein
VTWPGAVLWKATSPLALQTSPQGNAKLHLEIFFCLPDIYAPVLGQSMEIDELVVKLHRKVVQELEFQKRMFELLGTLDMILSSAH